MRKMGLAWGALAMLCGTAAQAAPKNAAPAASGAAGAAAVAPSSSATATTPAPSAAPPTPGAPAAEGATPAAPDALPTPPSEPAPEANNEEDEEEQAREAARKKRKRRRQLQVDAEEDEVDRHAVPTAEAPPPEEWHLVGPHFMLGVERVTNLLSWSITESVPVTTQNPNGFPTTTNVDLETSGTDVSFLGSGGSSLNLFGLPRVAIDGMFSNGLTLGGSISYMVTSGKSESTNGTNKTSSENPTVSVFIFAPRLGVVIPASPSVGVWLRGGLSRISASKDSPQTDPQTGASGATQTSTVTFVDFTLDPQLVITPVPHVGITLGALLDIGVSGTAETSGSITTHDVKASSYGVSGGLVAIF